MGCLNHDYQITEQADMLARQYRDFLVRDTGYKVSARNNMVSAWGVMFDGLLKTFPYKTVCAVLRSYIEEVQAKHCYVYTDPDSFAQSFYVLRSLWHRKCNPVFESEIDPLIQDFSKCNWDCNRATLVAVLGQSLTALRRFKSRLSQSDLSQAKKDYLESAFGSNFSYIRKKLLPPQPWSRDKTYRLPKPITYQSLCDEATRLLRAYGCDASILKGI